MVDLVIQVALYKSDFEEERKDRVTAHSKMADMEKEIAQVKGLSEQQVAAYIQENNELREYQHTTREQLQCRDQELQVVKRELQKHKQNLADLEIVHQKLADESGKELGKWRSQAVKAQSQLEGKASQVKQYAKENDKLKQKAEHLKLQVQVLL